MAEWRASCSKISRALLLQPVRVQIGEERGKREAERGKEEQRGEREVRRDERGAERGKRSIGGKRSREGEEERRGQREVMASCGDFWRALAGCNTSSTSRQHGQKTSEDSSAQCTIVHTSHKYKEQLKGNAFAIERKWRCVEI